MSKEEIIDRCLEIEQDYDSIIPIKLTSENIEDIDDIYQEKLEQQYYISELSEEYIQLNKELGYSNRRLYPANLRRVAN